jgi:hypothetical protein
MRGWRRNETVKTGGGNDWLLLREGSFAEASIAEKWVLLCRACNWAGFLSAKLILSAQIEDHDQFDLNHSRCSAVNENCTSRGSPMAPGH